MKSFVLFTVLAISLQSPAQSQTPQITSHRINDHLYVLRGGNGMGSHVGVLIGKDGLLLIDAMVTKSFPKLEAAIRKISDKPVRFVINTHDDFDHSGGNAGFAAQGADIITQANARYGSAAYTMTVKEQMTLTFGEEEIQAYHQVSHSPTDLIIYLPKSNVLFMGDVFAGGSLPTFFTGGKPGFDKAMDLAVSLADKDTLVVPGHGSFSNRQGLIDFQTRTAAWVQQIGRMHRAGKGVDGMVTDPRMLEVIAKFNTNQRKPFVAPKRLKRLTNRILNTDFVTPYALTAGNLTAYLGNYHYPDNELLELVELNGQLYARTPRSFMRHLTPLSKTDFHPRAHINGKHITFQFDQNGNVTGLLDLEGERAEKQR